MLLFSDDFCTQRLGDVESAFCIPHTVSAKSASHLSSGHVCNHCSCSESLIQSFPIHLRPRLVHLPLFSTSGLPMSTANQTAGPSRSDDNFTAIFQAALSEYETVTGKQLRTHPFATQLGACDSPQAVSSVLRTQAQAFSKFREGDGRLMDAWIRPSTFFFTFSATLGEGIGLVSICIRSMSLYSNIRVLAIFSRENYIHRDRCPSRGRSLPQVSCHAYA
jgi:hypothetical protein